MSGETATERQRARRGGVAARRTMTPGTAEAPADALDMSRVGAHQDGQGVDFGVWLPGITPDDGSRLVVKVIHEKDQFLQAIPPTVFELGHSNQAPFGDYWSGRLEIKGRPGLIPQSAWGRSGPDERYVYRYCLRRPDGSEIDWIVDPCAREFGVGKLSAFTLGYRAFAWDEASEAAFRVPALSEMVLYELNIAEFGGDIDRAIGRLDYLQDLGINAIEVMPVTNVAADVDWGYLPLGYFGVDERFGRRLDFQRFVQEAHRRGIAVIADAVYGHTADDFGYAYLYRRLGLGDGPFSGPFAGDAFGVSNDFRKLLTRDYFLAVNRHWLEVFHVDGFRYDYVPGYWDGPTGVGFARLVYETFQHVRRQLEDQPPLSPWTRFGSAGELRLVQCAEQLEQPVDVLYQSYANCTWQDRSYGAARQVARWNDRGRLADLGQQLGAQGFPGVVTSDGVTLTKAPLQYLENHDHERFISNFGLERADSDPLFNQGDRSRWFKLQPYLIGLLTSKGIPMLWQGQEFGENYILPDGGLGRVMVLRPMRWDYFYDQPGRSLISLVRRLVALRRRLPQLQTGEHFFFEHWERYQSKGLLLFARYSGARYTLVALNTSDQEQTAPFWFPVAGNYREELHGGALDLTGVQALQETWLTIPSHYGRVWTSQ
jgi:maltooligosyltrehalose trehalohydrolase